MTRESLVLVLRRFFCPPDLLVCGDEYYVFGYVKTCFRAYYFKTVYESAAGRERMHASAECGRRPCPLATTRVPSPTHLPSRHRPWTHATARTGRA